MNYQVISCDLKIIKYFLTLMNRLQLFYKYPPNIQKAEKHRLANRIFKGVEKDPLCEECECCDRKLGVQKVELTFCYDKSELAFLGPGIPLLFSYIRNSIVLLITLTLVFSGYCIYSNLSESYCSLNSINCQYNIFNTISFVNKMDNTDLLSIQNYIVLTFAILNIFMFQYFRYNFRQIEEQCDDIVNSPSDYAIILRRLPEQIQKKDVQRMVEERRAQLTEQEKNRTQNLKIDHIVLSYYMGDYTRVKQSNLQKLKELIQNNQHNQFKPQPFPNLIQSAKLAIIVFSHQQSKSLFLYKPSIFQKLIHFLCDSCTPLSNFLVKGERISIERAPEPDDVVWQNSKISIKGGIIRKSIFNILGVLLLLLGGFSQYQLAILQLSVADETIRQLLSIGLSVLVAIFNFLILQFLIFSTHKQRNETLTEFNTVLTVKITFFQFLNTGIFVILANFFADVKNFTITQTLTTDVTIVMLANAISPNLSLWVMNYFEITGKVFRWLVKSQKMKVTQQQANEIWQSPLAEIPYKYAYVLKTLWLTAFYAPLVPVVVPISIIGLTINYFIEKHLYRFVYSVPNMLSSMVNDSAIELMEYFPLILSLGQFIVYIYVKNYDVASLPVNWSIPIYVSIALSILNLLLPMDQLNKCIKLKNDDVKFPSYEEIQNKFQVTYQMTNPAYQCKKKRNRDVYLFNHIFGGESKDVAANLSGFLGLNDTNRSLMRDPLMNKKVNGENNKILGGLIEENQEKPVSKLNNKNVTPFNEGIQVKQAQNPFAKFMQFNAIGKNNSGNSITKNSEQLTVISNQRVNQIEQRTKKSEEKSCFEAKGNFPNQVNLHQQKNNFPPLSALKKAPMEASKNNYINNEAASKLPSDSNFQAQKNQNMLQSYKLNTIPVSSTVSSNQTKNQFKNLTKDLQFKYNNSNPNKNSQTNPNNQINPNNVINPNNQTNSNNLINSNNQINPSCQSNSNAQIDQENDKIQSDDKIHPLIYKKNREKQNSSSENEDILKNFPNLESERNSSKKTKQKFLSDSPSQIAHLNKRFTKSGVVFYQKPQQNPKYHFPHVQIHVPGFKASTDQEFLYRDGIQGEKRNKQHLGEKNGQKGMERGQGKRENEQYKADQIYNPRFSQRQPIDMSRLYGPPKLNK